MGKKKAPAKASPTSSRPRPEEAALSGPTPKFGQALASSDKDVRDKAVKALERYLRRAHDIEELNRPWRRLPLQPLLHRLRRRHPRRAAPKRSVIGSYWV